MGGWLYKKSQMKLKKIIVEKRKSMLYGSRERWGPHPTSDNTDRKTTTYKEGYHIFLLDKSVNSDIN